MRTFLFILCLLQLAACATTRRSKHFFQKNITSEIENSPIFNKAFTGFHLTDAATGQQLCAVNADRYFTPASNTKILTLAACLAVLGDSIPRFRYTSSEGAHVMTGTGDPTTLSPYFKYWQTAPDVFKIDPFAPKVLVESQAWPDQERYGTGWMWDDFHTAYSAELSPFPVYGNMVQVCWEGLRWETMPAVFLSDIEAKQSVKAVQRDVFSGKIYVNPAPSFSADTCFEIPMFSPSLKAYQLLSDSIDFAIPPEPGYPEIPLSTFKNSWYATPADTVYRRMMHQSDNFIAEQLLLVCAGLKFDTLQHEKTIVWAKDSLFAGFPDPPRWVDGSGLSRYNLISPRFLTALLQKLYREQSRERLFSLFPAGGASGTIQDWYRGLDGTPFVFAKTGSMSGVHCLSGYLKAKSGRVLIFSFMHNNFIGSNKAWKEEMQRLILEIYLTG